MYADEVFRGKLVRVDVVEEGGRGYEVVRMGDVAAVMAIREETGEILLVNQRRPAVSATMWEIPAGRVEDGESPFDCALRELAEETGHQASDAELLTSFYTSPGYSDERVLLYLVRNPELADHVPPMDDGEDIEWAWCSPEMMFRSRDAKTLAGLGFLLSSGTGEDLFRRG
ncbi:MAG: NUDIX hydrolase [Clostridia bacterium]